MASKRPKQHCYDYARPAMTVDVAIVTGRRPPKVLLVRRKGDPFAGRWALPGGFVDEGESLIDAARRELREETGLEVDGLEQLAAFGDPGRDPRGWTVSVVFHGRLKKELAASAADDADGAAWFPLHWPPELAFDHAQILSALKTRL